MRGIREPVNFYTHAIPALLTIPACTLLLVRAHGLTEVIAALVYGACAFVLFSISSIYHSCSSKEQTLRFWQKFDHCCIYLMIAGSYTPTSLLVFHGWIKWTLLFLVWTIASVGCTLKICNRIFDDKLSLPLYIGMGCLIVPLIREMTKVLPTAAIVWMILGGIFYIGGTYFYYKDCRWGKYIHTHEIWHVFVVLGAITHFIYNYFYLFV